MLKATNLTKMFGGLAAVHDVSVEFEANRINAMPRQDILRHVHQRLSSASRVQRNCRMARRDSLPREQCRTVFPALSEHSTMLGDWGIKADDKQPEPKHDLKPTPAFQTMLKPAVDDRTRTDLKPILKPASRYWCATESSCSSAQRPFPPGGGRTGPPTSRRAAARSARSNR